MSWAVGYDDRLKRDVGYGVPASCDHPDCNRKIDRGLSYVCGGEPEGSEQGCGLHFCGSHLFYDRRGAQLCTRCYARKEPFEPKADHPEWVEWKLTDESWAGWRAENANEVAKMRSALSSEPNDA